MADVGLNRRPALVLIDDRAWVLIVWSDISFQKRIRLRLSNYNAYEAHYGTYEAH